MLLPKWMCLLFLPSVCSFYLPGVAPRDYDDGEPVDVKVNKIESVKTQLPYDYYSLPFCRPNLLVESSENIGEILSGDMIQNSKYEIYMKQVEECKILCRMNYSKEEMLDFKEKVEESYKVNWIVDNIPAGTKYYFETDDPQPNDVKEGDNWYTEHYDKGFDMGAVVDEKAYLNNHHRLTVFYHEDPKTFTGARIVAFEVEPFSVNHVVEGAWQDTQLDNNKLKTCSTPISKGKQALEILPDGTLDQRTVIWTYDIRWEFSSIKWASRWDLYLKMTDSQIHWFSITNSIMIVLFLSGMVAMILMRALHRDLRRYNEIDAEEQAEETGWKLVHGDVFRPPSRGACFAICYGTGVQIFCMTVLTLIFAALGFLSPANRGGLMTAFLVIFVFMGMVAGYSSTKTYNMFRLGSWKKNAAATGLTFPALFFGVFFLLNLVVWGQKSSGAVPFGTLVVLLVLWFCISLPLVYLGSFLANRQAVPEFPVRVNSIPRALNSSPENSQWYNHPVLSLLLGGILPFGAVFIEIYLIMYSVWLHQFYYVFGFLLIVFLILIITCAEISIVMVYFQLCQEDYHWWWRSFLTAGSSAVYLFLYSILYFFTKLEIVKFASGLLFFGYMFLISIAFFLLTGTMGYTATYYFVRKIYSSLKLD